jgi:hypothetical protein
VKWMDLILAMVAAASPLGAILGGVVYYRQNRQKKDLELVQTRTQIEIDETTRNKLIQEAATVNQEREQRREEWWGQQIKVLRDEIEAERQLSNKRFRRLNQLEEWATLHVAWDRKAWARIREDDPEFEPPPTLPEYTV